MMYYLSLGSNLGDRPAWLRWGVDRLDTFGQVSLLSNFYETKPWGKSDQGDFLNAVVEFKCDHDPEGLLGKLKEIEKASGRDFSVERWGPRTLDIDILLCGQDQRVSPGLTIPHPRLCRRDFVLAPLAEIAPSVPVPGTGKTCAQLWMEWQDSHPDKSTWPRMAA